ncbi:hypothetical protein [Tistrella mobilis]|uniref:hypothetical protein n=1 Tax=Tistrella mobilis TaxID=171437 RepID=UPI0002DC59D6|nr:hypothetical protein [Tistrella mobilis]
MPAKNADEGPWPTSGGSYLRDPVTGALTRRQPGDPIPSASASASASVPVPPAPAPAPKTKKEA